MPRFFSSDKLNIYLATYDRGPGKPDHWAIVIARSEDAEDGHTFQIVHGRPFFEYRYRSNARLSASSSLKKYPTIGKVKKSKISEIDEAPGSIEVINNDENWNCQNWIREAVMMLENMGHVTKGTAENIYVILA